MDHDVRHFELGEVEQAADAVAILTHHLAIATKIVDGAAQFVMGRTLRLDPHKFVAEKRQQARSKDKGQQTEAGKRGNDDPAGLAHPR